MFKTLLKATPSSFIEHLRTANFISSSDCPHVCEVNEQVYFLNKELEPSFKDGETIKDHHLRFAAVCTLFSETSEGLQLLICKKTKQVEGSSEEYHEHAGQVGFPGGMKLELEGTLQAALRELHEEIHFSDDQYVEIINQLPKFHVNVSNIDVYPFIGVLKNKNHHHHHHNNNNIEIGDTRELSIASWIHVNDLMNNHEPNGLIVNENIIEIGHQYNVVSSNNQHLCIWGLSSRVLTHLFLTLENRMKNKGIKQDDDF